jgi:hypothetical protein
MLRTRDAAIADHVRRIGRIDAEFAGEELPRELPEDRRLAIAEIEAAYPIPRMRGPAFAALRRRLRDAAARAPGAPLPEDAAAEQPEQETRAQPKPVSGQKEETEEKLGGSMSLRVIKLVRFSLLVRFREVLSNSSPDPCHSDRPWRPPMRVVGIVPPMTRIVA